MRMEWFQRQARNGNGFTLLEMLLVLAVLTVCLAAAAIPLRNAAEQVQDRQFFQQVERDLLAAQAYAVSKNKNVAVHFFEGGRNTYRIYTYESPGVTVQRRDIPKKFSHKEQSMSQLVYLRTGVTNRFGTVYFISAEKETKLVFLIGRGRFYFTEE